MSRWIKNSLLLGMVYIAVGCGGSTEEVAPVTEPGANASDAEMKARMEESMKKSGRDPNATNTDAPK